MIYEVRALTLKFQLKEMLFFFFICLTYQILLFLGYLTTKRQDLPSIKTFIHEDMILFLCNLHDLKQAFCKRKFVPEKIGRPFEVSISHFRIVTFLCAVREITKKIWVKLCSKDSFTHSFGLTIVRKFVTNFRRLFPRDL